MQIGDLSRTHVPQEMRDSAARQALRVLLVAGLIAGGSLALWLTGGSGSSAGGMVAVAPPQTASPDRPTAAPVQVADAAPSAPIAAASAPLGSGSPPERPSQDWTRAPAEPAPVPSAALQVATAPKQPDAAIDPPAPSPAPPTDMNMTGTVTQQASLAESYVPAGGPDAGLVDLNRASIEQLNNLKGTGSLGRAIVKGRPYRSVEDLVKKKVLRRTAFEKIKDQVTVQ